MEDAQQQLQQHTAQPEDHASIIQPGPHTFMSLEALQTACQAAHDNDNNQSATGQGQGFMDGIIERLSDPAL